MKKILTRLVIFCIPLAILFATIEVLVRQIPNPYSTKMTRLKQDSGSINTIILGSSHAYFGIDADSLPGKCLNLANVSQSLDYDEWVLEKYLTALPSLKNVIISVSYFSINSTLEDSVESWKRAYYVIYWRYPGYYPLKYNLEITMDPRLAVSRIIAYNITNTWRQDWSASGTGTGYSITNRSACWKDTGPTASSRHTYPYNEHIAKKNIERLVHIVQLCKTHGVKPILLMTPTYETYFKNLELQQLRAAAENYAAIARDYQVEFLDLLTDKRFTESDFFDADHLCTEGAKKLSYIQFNMATHL